MATWTSFFDSIAQNVKKEVKKLPKTEEIKSVSSKVDFSEILKNQWASDLVFKKTNIEKTYTEKPKTQPKVEIQAEKTEVKKTRKAPKKAKYENGDTIKSSSSNRTFKNLTEFCIQWAKDIIAEDVSDHANLRDDIKTRESIDAVVQTKETKTFESDWVYKIYWNYSRKISEMPSYAYLAVSRAEKEKQITVNLNMHTEKISQQTKKYFLPSNANTSKIYLEEAIEDWLKRLLLPSLEREIRRDKKQRADEAAIKVFGENMKNLLLTPPVKGMTVLWFDPWFRTWCKIAVVDQTWKFLENTVVYPTEPQKDFVKSEKILIELIKKHKIDLIVIWNGTASRESERFIADMIKKNKLSVKYAITSEAWASVYSASVLWQEEYPNLDVTVRWAISIAHRVQDPLAEFTKIDPKSIGVWQYQHDVDQDLLHKKLDEKVQDTVNAVWVDVNTASYTLLWYIAWLSKKTAQNIVNYRDDQWQIKAKKEIKKIWWLGPKAYEQCVWFLRIKNWEEALDSTWIHPDNHKLTYEILEKEFGMKKKDVKLPIELKPNNIWELSKKYEIWFETLEDIFKELARPWLDPRDWLPTPNFKSDVLDFKDVQVGMVLEWVIRNVTDFWAFVDIGLHNDWLVHISEIANHFVSNPVEVVSVWQPVKVKVIGTDPKNEKVQLSIKALQDPAESNSYTPSPNYVPREKTQEKYVVREEKENDEPTTMKGNISFS